MSRSVRDLRELICMSRLSYHGEEDDQNPDELNSNTVPKETKSDFSTKKVSQKKVMSSVSPPRTPGSSGRGSPLPPIGKSPLGSNDSSSSSLSSGRNSPLNPSGSDQGIARSSITRNYKPLKGNFDSLLSFSDAAIIGEWLTRANKTVSELTSWFHSGDTFINFGNFWLNEVSPSKRSQLISMEYSIVMDELMFAFGVGLQGGELTEHDIVTFMNAVLWEYPQKFSASQSSAYFLNILMCLCCGRKDNYRKLLSDVKCSTSNKQFVQFILATRAFAIVSLCSGVLQFYKQIHTLKDSSTDLPEACAPQGQEICEVAKQFAFQAIQKGFVEVFKYFLLNFEFELEEESDADRQSFVFATIIHGQEEMLGFLLKQTQLNVDVNKRSSSSGNTPLHTAVNAGNLNIVKLLAEAGADMNAWNCDCEGATPLHLAIISDNKDMVHLLLSLDCDPTVKMGVPATVTPLKLAKDLGLDEVVSVLETFKI
ncbi:hypothetical protein QZH41_019148 [Actinostola sp. cb2023]|nr:hypothetical protein QZH41_019148 [Actinostola sp. cb2023]